MTSYWVKGKNRKIKGTSFGSFKDEIDIIKCIRQKLKLKIYED